MCVTILRGIMAGVMIALAATGYLSLDNSFLGSSVFSIGLFGIYYFGFYLYTGKVGFVVKDKNPLKVLTILFSNIIGTVSCALLLRQTRLVDSYLMTHVIEVAEHKVHDSLLSIFILAVFCGFLMYIAASAFQKGEETNNRVFSAIVIYLCVVVFLLSSFDHSIANSFYITLAGKWSITSLIATIVSILGNATGGILIGVTMQYLDKKH